MELCSARPEADERTLEQMIADVLDRVALGYPHDGTPQETARWMASLQDDFERRAPAALSRFCGSTRHD